MVTTKKRTDPVKIWFFVVLGLLVAATANFVFVVNGIAAY